MTEVGQHTQGIAEWVSTPDGRRLFAMALPGTGSAVPTVVFEAGAAASRSSWATVQPGAARSARSVVYDRSGLGRSAPDPHSRTLSRMADDLNAVLDHFEPGSFILVGHSAGGPIVRLAASRRPERIAGLVLVDPTDEGADVLFTCATRRVERIALRVTAIAARTGLLKHTFRWLLTAMPTDVRHDLEREGFTPGVVRTQRRQARTFLDELAAWRQSPPELGDIPVIVISGERADSGMSASVREAANTAHAHRAAQSPHGNPIIAERSGHYVPITRPDVVIRAVTELLHGSQPPSGPRE